MNILSFSCKKEVNDALNFYDFQIPIPQNLISTTYFELIDPFMVKGWNCTNLLFGFLIVRNLSSGAWLRSSLQHNYTNIGPGNRASRSLVLLKKKKNQCHQNDRDVRCICKIWDLESVTFFGNTGSGFHWVDFIEEYFMVSPYLFHAIVHYPSYYRQSFGENYEGFSLV